MPSQTLRLSSALGLRALVLGMITLTGLQSARADLVELEFRGVVVEEDFRVGSTSALSLGTFVEGVFSYNDEATGQTFGPNQARYFNSVTSNRIDVQGETFTANTFGNIIVDNHNGPSFDRISIMSSSFANTGTINDMKVVDSTLTLKDSTATVFNSTALPSSISMDSFDTRTMLVTFSNAAGTAVTTYRVEVTSVPEPSSLVFLLAGAPFAIYLLIRKRSAKVASA